MSASSLSLLKFQVGPVQDFIAQARSTRDLWSGSYLLSWLIAAGIRELTKPSSVELIYPYPDPKSQPLLDPLEGFARITDQKPLLTPNLTNIFVARVPAESADALARKVQGAIEGEWEKIANSVWKIHADLGVDDGMEARFNSQWKKHLSIAWLATPETGDYRRDYATNGWQLDAVRQTRDFKGRKPEDKDHDHEKDSLNGREEAVAGGKQNGESYQSRIDDDYSHLFKHDDHLGAVALIKRLWHLTYLKSPPLDLRTSHKEFHIPSIPAIAARKDTHDDDETKDPPLGEKYVAAIAFDGDSIGAWISGEWISTNLHQHHQDFSRCLSDFALKRAREIIEDGHAGFLIYAGGDDVLALVPADNAIACAEALRRAFREATGEIKGKDQNGNAITPDASAGIAIAHIKSPLQDLIREAQEAERRAKIEVGRPAFSATLMKRSGEISHWGAKWDKGGIKLHDKIAGLMTDGNSDGHKLSSKFPHRVCELLAPYLTSRSEFGKLENAPGFDATSIIAKEFRLAAERQGSDSIAETLLPLLKTYLTSLDDDPQNLLRSLIGLCSTVSFAHRNRPSTAKRHDSA